MGWWGKLLGGGLGFMLTGGPLGMVLGAALGHQFDRGLSGVPDGMESIRPGGQQRVQTAFFTSTFSVLGCVAKADGRVSQHEIALAEAVMSKMALDSQMRETAIQLFNEGKKPDFPLDDVLQQFKTECHRRMTLIQMFIEIQLQAAYADGQLDPAEERVLLHICQKLGFSVPVFRQLEEQIKAQTRFSGDVPNRPTAVDAYKVLGIDESVTDSEVKKAYRRQISQHHPDKLVAKGLPEEMMKIAAEKTHEIKQAYEQIRKRRGF